MTLSHHLTKVLSNKVFQAIGIGKIKPTNNLKTPTPNRQKKKQNENKPEINLKVSKLLSTTCSKVTKKESEKFDKKDLLKSLYHMLLQIVVKLTQVMRNISPYVEDDEFWEEIKKGFQENHDKLSPQEKCANVLMQALHDVTFNKKIDPIWWFFSPFLIHFVGITRLKKFITFARYKIDDSIDAVKERMQIQ